MITEVHRVSVTAWYHSLFRLDKILHCKFALHIHSHFVQWYMLSSSVNHSASEPQKVSYLYYSQEKWFFSISNKNCGTCFSSHLLLLLKIYIAIYIPKSCLLFSNICVRIFWPSLQLCWNEIDLFLRSFLFCYATVWRDASIHGWIAFPLCPRRHFVLYFNVFLTCFLFLAVFKHSKQTENAGAICREWCWQK